MVFKTTVEQEEWQRKLLPKALVSALELLDYSIRAATGYEIVITCIYRNHRSYQTTKRSYHRLWQAVDIRTKNMSAMEVGFITKYFRKIRQIDSHIQAVWEGDHLHIEYDTSAFWCFT